MSNLNSNTSNPINSTKLNSDTIQFDLSDSDVSDDCNLNHDFKIDSTLLDKLELQYYPEPYNALGQFIVSAISGTASSYILSSRAKVSRKYKDHLNAYFAYCKKVESDEYVDSILSTLKLDRTNEEDKIKFEVIMERTNKVCSELMDEFIESTVDKYAKYILASDEEFSIELFNADVIKDIIGIIKFSKISEIV
jgi:hypothetical protein